ncbi:MAG: hypothetical protein N2234_03710 [Planctomycetota bacterium]|nr:hypothetical protein [Planctomycetota bacterium]
MGEGGKEPRIGVFVCHCGANIAQTVDVESIAERAKSLPGVVDAKVTVQIEGALK